MKDAYWEEIMKKRREQQKKKLEKKLKKKEEKEPTKTIPFKTYPLNIRKILVGGGLYVETCY